MAGFEVITEADGTGRSFEPGGRWFLLRIVDIGQEFVLDADYYPKAYQWLARLFRPAA